MEHFADHDYSHLDIMESSVGSHLDNLDLSGSSIKSNSSFSVPPPLIECGLNSSKLKAANSLNNSNFVRHAVEWMYHVKYLTVDCNSQVNSLVGGYRRCRALYDCNADNDDELEFKEGEILIVLNEKTDDENWMEGQIEGDNSRRGMFPISFVHMLPD